MVGESCDECGKEIWLKPPMDYIRFQVWGNQDLCRFERVFCSVKCMKKYTKEWTDKDTFGKRIRCYDRGIEH